MEFQKRGLPHAHILLILHKDDALQDADDWDAAVSAELPDQQQRPEVAAMVFPLLSCVCCYRCGWHCVCTTC